MVNHEKQQPSSEKNLQKETKQLDPSSNLTSRLNSVWNKTKRGLKVGALATFCSVLPFLGGCGTEQKRAEKVFSELPANPPAVEQIIQSIGYEEQDNNEEPVIMKSSDYKMDINDGNLSDEDKEMYLADIVRRAKEGSLSRSWDQKNMKRICNEFFTKLADGEASKLERYNTWKDYGYILEDVGELNPAYKDIERYAYNIYSETEGMIDAIVEQNPGAVNSWIASELDSLNHEKRVLDKARLKEYWTTRAFSLIIKKYGESGLEYVIDLLKNNSGVFKENDIFPLILRSFEYDNSNPVSVGIREAHEQYKLENGGVGLYIEDQTN